MGRMFVLMFPASLAFTGCANSDQKPFDRNAKSVAANAKAKQPDSFQVASVAPAVVPDTLKIPPTPPSSQTPARDGDQRWLRSLADRQAVIVAVAHGQMSRHSSELMANPDMATQHDMSTDPGALQDSEHDGDLRNILSLLSSAYGERYEPVVSSAERHALDSLQSLPESTYDKTFRSFVVQEHQRQLELIHSGMPHLERADTRALARRLLAAYQQEIARLTAEEGAQ